MWRCAHRFMRRALLEGMATAVMSSVLPRCSHSIEKRDFLILEKVQVSPTPTTAYTIFITFTEKAASVIWSEIILSIL